MSDYGGIFHRATVCVVIPVTERNRAWLTSAAELFTLLANTDDVSKHAAELAAQFPNNHPELRLVRGDGEFDPPFVLIIEDDKAYFLDRTGRVHMPTLMAVLQEYLLAHPGVGDIAFAWKSSLQRLSPDFMRAGVCLVTRFVVREITTESLIEDWCLERQLEATSNLRSEDPDTFYTPGIAMHDDDEGTADAGEDDDDADAEDE